MNANNLDEKPWLNSTGKIFDDEILKKISQDWSAETWERFLANTVDVEREENELLMDGYQQLLEEKSDGLPWPSCSLPKCVVNQIRISKSTLTPQQRVIIELIFWGQKSERQVAQELATSQQLINRTKKISLNKIKAFLKKDVVTQSYLIGRQKNLSPRERSRDEQLVEVYRADLRGGHHV